MRIHRRHTRSVLLASLAIWTMMHTIIASPLITHAAAPIPRPVAIWPDGPIDLIATFERPLDPPAVASLIGQTISFRAKDGPKAATDGPLGSIRIAGAGLEDEGRTVRLATDPHPVDARYTLSPANSEVWSYDLRGVEASWSEREAAPDAPPGWSGWLPVIDPEESRMLVKGSVPHERGFSLFGKDGFLTIATQVAFPRGDIRLDLATSCPIEEFIVGNEAFQAEEGKESVRNRELTVTSEGELQFVSIRVKTIDARPGPSITLRYRMGDDSESRRLDRGQFLLPWAPAPSAPDLSAGSSQAPPAASLIGGDAARGETLFYGDQAQCSRCHRVRGKGGEIGPDLTSIAKKGAADIYRSIATPSATIEPNYVAFNVSTNDGRVVVGIVRADGTDTILVGDTNAKSTRLARREIDQIRPASASIMPVGLASAIGEDRLRDLIAFLMSAETR